VIGALADEAIHIELTWSTPNDPDETDHGPEAGSDVDLHFAAPGSQGWADQTDVGQDGELDLWFDMDRDCFWSCPGSVDSLK
jgi:hypothetical protein